MRLASRKLETPEPVTNSVYYHYMNENFTPASTVTGMSFGGGNINITFTSETGFGYNIQGATTMNGPWTTIGTVTATGSSYTYAVPVTLGYFFFRISKKDPETLSVRDASPLEVAIICSIFFIS